MASGGGVASCGGPPLDGSYSENFLDRPSGERPGNHLLKFPYSSDEHTTKPLITPKKSFKDVFIAKNVCKLEELVRRGAVQSYLECLTKIGMDPVSSVFLMGIDVTAVQNLYDILKLEGVHAKKIRTGKTNYEDSFVSTFKKFEKVEGELKDVLTRLHKFTKQHFWASLTNTVNFVKRGYKLQDVSADEYVRFNSNFSDMQRAVASLHDMKKLYINSPVRGFLTNLASSDKESREDFKELAAEFKEADLQRAIEQMLMASMVVRISGHRMKLPFGSITHDSFCETDILVDSSCFGMEKQESEVPVKVTGSSVLQDEDADDDGLEDIKQHVKNPRPSKPWIKKQDENWMENVAGLENELELLVLRNVEATQIKNKFTMTTKLLWQIFEQLLGHMLKLYKQSSLEKIADTARIFRPCILVANDMVHVFVMTMAVGTFKELRKSYKAADTMKLILDHAEKGKSFCNMYVGTQTKHICDTFALVRGCAQFFSNIEDVC